MFMLDPILESNISYKLMSELKLGFGIHAEKLVIKVFHLE